LRPARFHATPAFQQNLQLGHASTGPRRTEKLNNRVAAILPAATGDAFQGSTGQTVVIVGNRCTALRLELVDLDRVVLE
jgi:hypothetical protein